MTRIDKMGIISRSFIKQAIWYVTVHKKFLGFRFLASTCLMRLLQFRSFSSVSKKIARTYIWTSEFRWRTHWQNDMYESSELTHLTISQWLFQDVHRVTIRTERSAQSDAAEVAAGAPCVRSRTRLGHKAGKASGATR